MRYLRWILLAISIVWVVASTFNMAFAHADLVMATPTPNTYIKETPPEIRLTFSESLEPRFSKIEIRDATGRVLDTPTSYIDPDAPTEMILIPPQEIPDGLYTVVWRAASAYDGHVTEGSFALGIGEVSSQINPVAAMQEPLPLYSVIIRWLNFLSFALGIGGLGFAVFVWNLAEVGANQRLHRWLWWGWISLGITTFLTLWLNISTLSDEFLPDPTEFLQTITSTLMGNYWLARLAFWVLMGFALKWAGENRVLALGLGICLLLTHSLYSHASAVPYLSSAAILSDWLHLLVMTLWVGGVLMLLVLLFPLLHQPEVLGKLLGYFSNYARVLVVVLILTGIYAAWLQVGRIDGLTTTIYGQALLAKLILMLPILGLASINFVFTARGLRAGQLVWGRRLRWLTGAELSLLLMVLGAVGVMTAISPARNELLLEEIPPIQKTVTTEGIDVQLDMASGIIGENTVTVLLAGDDEKLAQISAVILELEYQNVSIGTNTFILNYIEEGIYRGSGVNMSAAGAWAVGVNIERGNQPPIETVFGVQLKNPPTPQPLVSPEADYQRGTMWLGVALLLTGSGFLVLSGRSKRLDWVYGDVVIAGLVVLVGGFLLSQAGMTAQTVNPTTTALAFEPIPDLPSQVLSLRDSELPLLLTPSGELYRSNSSQLGAASLIWEAVPFESSIQFAYVDSFGNLWVCGDTGAFIQTDSGWQQISGRPASSIVETHGYLYILGRENLLRLESGKYRQMDIRALNTPALPVHNMVMLGNHTHVIESSGQVYQSLDVGLSWQPLDAPEAAAYLATDIDGNLLAATSNGIQKWDTMTRLWIPFLELPAGQAVDSMTVFQNRLYALAGGKLYIKAGEEWKAVPVEGRYFTSMTLQYPDRLWLLDAAETRLWWSLDGENWEALDVELEK